MFITILNTPWAAGCCGPKFRFKFLIFCFFRKIFLFIYTVFYNYFLIYIFYIIPYALSLLTITVISSKYLSPKSQSMFIVAAYLISFLNLAGIPITLGFFSKVPLMVLLLNKSFYINYIIIIFINILTMYIYINIFSDFFFKKKAKIISISNKNSFFIVPMFLFLSTLGFLLSSHTLTTLGVFFL